MVMINGDPGGAAEGWQGDGVDVEISRVPTRYGDQFLWAVYDRDKEVKVGAARTERRAVWRARFVAWRYRAFSRR